VATTSHSLSFRNSALGSELLVQKDKEWLVVVYFVVAPPCTTLQQKIIVVHESNHDSVKEVTDSG